MELASFGEESFSVLERRPDKARVGGSNPSGRTKKLLQKVVYFCVPRDIISLLDGNTIQSLFKSLLRLGIA